MKLPVKQVQLEFKVCASFSVLYSPCDMSYKRKERRCPELQGNGSEVFDEYAVFVFVVLCLSALNGLNSQYAVFVFVLLYLSVLNRLNDEASQLPDDGGH